MIKRTLVLIALLGATSMAQATTIIRDWEIRDAEPQTQYTWIPEPGHTLYLLGEPDFIDANNEGEYFYLDTSLPSGFDENIDDGTAHLYGTVSNKDNTTTFVIDFKYSGYTETAPGESPKRMNCAAYVDAIAINPDCLDRESKDTAPGPVDTETFWYYPGLTGTLTEVGGSSLVLQVDRKGPAFQVGEGANVSNVYMGASGWMEVYQFVDGACTGPGLNVYTDTEVDGKTITTTQCYIEYHGDININLVPEPATLLLMGIGLAGLGFARRRRLNC